MRLFSKSRYALLLSVVVMGWFLALMPGLSAQAASAPENSASAAEHGGAGDAREGGESAGEDETAQFKHSPAVQWIAEVTGLSLEQAYWLSVSLNFLVIAAAIFWLSKKNLPAMFRNRTVSIQKAMEEARQASEDANRRLGEIETRLTRLDGEIGEMRGAADNEALAEEARIKAAAEEDARKVVEAAQQEIAAAAKAARRELTAYAADLAVTLARQQVHVDPATDEALVRSFAEQLTNGARPKGGKD